MQSKYLKTREKEGRVAIFHELHPYPVYSTVERWKRYDESNDSALTAALRQKGLIVDSPDDDERAKVAAMEGLKKRLDHATILYLMTAQGCNQNCGYCPVPEIAARYGESMLSTESAIAGIRLWKEHLRETYDPETPYYVIFYGGEPLLNKRTVIETIEYLRLERDALPKKLNVMVSTNGTLIDEELLSLFKNEGILVAVGLDGPKELHDRYRVYMDGRGTFDDVIAAIKKLVARGIKTFVSTSITPEALSSIGELSSYFKGFGIEQFGFNFLKGRKLTEIVGVSGIVSYSEAAVAGVIESAQREKGRVEYQIEKKRTVFLSGNFFPVDCTCYGNQLVVQPDGEISNCPFHKARLGNIEKVPLTFRIWDQAVVKQWRRRLPLTNPNYSTIDAKAVCGSGCAWSSLETEGHPFALDFASKCLSEEVFGELIWSKFDSKTAY
jgi:uncharacterized protein